MAYPLQQISFSSDSQIEDSWHQASEANYKIPGLVSWEQLDKIASKKPVLAPTAKVLERDRINLLTIGETYTLPTGETNTDPIQWIIPSGSGTVTVDGNVYNAPQGKTSSGYEVYWDGAKYVAIAYSGWRLVSATGKIYPGERIICKTDNVTLTPQVGSAGQEFIVHNANTITSAKGIKIAGSFFNPIDNTTTATEWTVRAGDSIMFISVDDAGTLRLVPKELGNARVYTEPLFGYIENTWIRSGNVYYSDTGNGLNAPNAIVWKKVNADRSLTTVTVAAGAITFDTVNIATNATILTAQTVLPAKYINTGSSNAVTDLPANSNVIYSLWFNPADSKWKLIIGSRLDTSISSLMSRLPLHVRDAGTAAGGGWLYTGAFIVRSGATAGTLVSNLNLSTSATFANASEFSGLTFGGSSASAAAAATIQTLNATGDVTSWNSTVLIGTTAPTANMTLTLPTAAGATGQEITFIRADNTAFTVTIATQSGETLTLTNGGTELAKTNGALTVQSVTSTTIRQTSSIDTVPLTWLIPEATAIAPSMSTIAPDGRTVARWLLSSSQRTAIIRQETATTAGTLFTDINAILTTATLTIRTAVALRLDVGSATTDHVAASTTAIPAGWYAVSFSGTKAIVQVLGGGAATAPTIQALNATGDITAWESTVLIGTTAPTANMTLKLPTAAGNIGKQVRFVRVDNTAFAVTIATQTGETLTLQSGGTELSRVNGALTVQAMTATTIRQNANIGVAPLVAEYVYASLSPNTLVNNGAGIPFTTRSGTIPNTTGVFSLKANQTYKLVCSFAYEGTEGNGFAAARWRDITGNVLLGNVGVAFSEQFTFNGSGNNRTEAIFTPTVDSTVRVENISGVGNNRTFGGGNNGQTFAYIETIAGHLPISTSSNVLTQRAITGSLTATAYDGITTPHQISLTAGTQLATVTASAGTISIIDARTGRVAITPSGSDVAVTHTVTTWRRSLTATNATGGAAVNLNGAASLTIDATLPVTCFVTMADRSCVTGVTATNATVNSFDAAGRVVITPDNAGDVALSVTFSTMGSSSQLVGQIGCDGGRTESGAAKTNAQYVAEGKLPLVGGFTLTGGATANPKVALMWPELVSGANLLVPTTWAGIFLRNNGTNGDYASGGLRAIQDDATARNGLSAAFNTYRASYTTGSGSSTAGLWNDGGASSARDVTVSSSEAETRPVNMAVRYFIYLDSFTFAYAIPSATVVREEATITADSTNIGKAYTGSTTRLRIPIAAGQMITGISVPVAQGVATLVDPFSGAVDVTPAVGQTALAITSTFAAATTRSYSFAAFRTDNATISITTGQPTWTNIRFQNNEPNYSAAQLIHSSGDVIIPRTGRVLVESKWWNEGTGDQRITLRHKNSSGTLIQDFGNALSLNNRASYSCVVINATAGDRLNWVGAGAAGATNIFWGEGATELRVTSLEDTGKGYVVPVGTIAFAARTISGPGVTAAIGRDNTVTTVTVTGIAAGSEVALAPATGGAIVQVKDPGRNGTALIDVIPNGADVVITPTITVWRRTITAVNASGGAVVNVNNAASALIDATRIISVSLTVPSNSQMQSVTATNATVLSQNGNGFIELAPSNAGDIVLTATFVPIQGVVGGTASYLVAGGTSPASLTGAQRTGGISRPSDTTSQFLMEDGNWDGQLLMPVPANANSSFRFSNYATLSTTVLATNTDLAAGVSVASNQSIHFVSGRNTLGTLVWRWVPAPFVISGATTTSITLGNIDSNGTTSYYYAYPAGMRLTQIVFDMRDRRGTQAYRRQNNLRVLASDMPAGGNGWTATVDNTPARNGVTRDFTLVDAGYTALIQWRLSPGGFSLWFQDAHAGNWNAFGRYENVVLHFGV